MTIDHREYVGGIIPIRSKAIVWDRHLIPMWRSLDPLFGNRLGKSVLAIWQRI